MACNRMREKEMKVTPARISFAFSSAITIFLMVMPAHAQSTIRTDQKYIKTRVRVYFLDSTFS